MLFAIFRVHAFTPGHFPHGGGAGEGTTKRLLGLVPELVSLCAASTPRSEGKGSADPWAKWRPCGDDGLGNQVSNCRTKFISTFCNQQVFKYKTNTRDYSCDLSRCTNYVYLYSLRTRIFIKNIRIRSTIVSTSKTCTTPKAKVGLPHKAPFSVQWDTVLSGQGRYSIPSSEEDSWSPKPCMHQWQGRVSHRSKLHHN
jgi:hypothetical protein